MNILERDFFKVSPGSVAYVPYVVRTAKGEQRRQITIPLADAIVANPPYTRWLEIPGSSREAIEARLGTVLREYGLTAVVRGGVETAIYQHFVMHGRDFLKEGGRLAMIVSSSWLQTEVGVKFAAYLLDHFRVHAVIDLGPRIFPVPLVGTCLLLMERCEDARKRAATDTLFAFVEEQASVDDLMLMLQRPDRYQSRFHLAVASQGRLPRDEKWIGELFGFPALAERIRSRTIPARELYGVTKGTIGYCAEKNRGLGANRFFFLAEDEVRDRDLKAFAQPALSRSLWLPTFTFGRSDWDGLRKGGKTSFLFSCRLARKEMPRHVLDYVKWGETQCRNRDGLVCAESQSCGERAKDSDNYSGWYDVGNVRGASFLAPYYAQYRRRFALLTTKVATDHDFLAFSSLSPLRPDQHKAVLAALNSSIGQAFVEAAARTTGGGMASLELDTAQELPIPDVRKMPAHRLRALAGAFDALETAARSLGGAHRRESEARLRAEYDRLDKVVARSVRLTQQEMSRLRSIWTNLLERRIARAPEPTPETLRGRDKMLERPPRHRKREPRSVRSRSLEEFDKGE